MLEDLFDAGGAKLEDYLEIEKLNPITRYWFADGKHVVSSPNTEEFAASLENAGIATASELKKYLKYSKRIWDITHELFMERSLHEPADLFRGGGLWKSLLRIGGIDPLRSMDRAHRAFFSSPNAVQLFNRYATYNGSDPFAVPATLNIIPHVEYGIGGYAVKKRYCRHTRALEKLARTLGVEFRFNTRVVRILTEGRPGCRRGQHATRVAGVRLAAPGAETGATDSEEFPAHQIICNADVTPAYHQLLNDPAAPLARRYARLEPSSSGLVFFWAMGSDYSELGLHNIFFSSDYRREFRDIFEHGQCPDEPTVYVNISSKVDRSDAPSPGESWFVLVNASADSGQDWPAEAERVRSAVLRRIEAVLGRNVSDDIRHESILSPPDIEANTSSNHGSLYGISSNSRSAAFLRHPNRSRRYRGLYFCGGSAHPGGGMPLAMLSGKIAAELAVKHGARR